MWRCRMPGSSFTECWTQKRNPGYQPFPASALSTRNTGVDARSVEPALGDTARGLTQKPSNSNKLSPEQSLDNRVTQLPASAMEVS